MGKARKSKSKSVTRYGETVLGHLRSILAKNKKTLERIALQVVSDVAKGRSLFVFGSGHSAIFPMELYHRAGGVSFVIPVVAEDFLPISGPALVREWERTPGAARFLLERAKPKRGEMLWIASQSGINAAVVDVALQAREMGMRTVAFTSLPHSRAVKSRHPSGKRLFEICDEVVDLGGFPGDACVPLGDGLNAGPLSTLSAVFLGHSILVGAAGRLEARGRRCVYSSVNTPTGEKRNQALERRAALRDPLLKRSSTR